MRLYHKELRYSGIEVVLGKVGLVTGLNNMNKFAVFF